MLQWAGVLGLVVALSAGAGAAIVVETVPVANPGNVGELSGTGAGGMGPDRLCGRVGYVYSMAIHEVSAAQYTEFLNAVAALDTYGLYDPRMWSELEGCRIQRGGPPGSYTYCVEPDWAERPVNFVSWGDAARLANWLHNGQPAAPQGPATTETGSYALNGATGDPALMTVKREQHATWVIPGEDEWYKAAYHRNDGVTGNYWDYPTASDVAPSNQLRLPDPGNNANFDDGSYTIGPPCYRTIVGEFENSDSAYGTFDQGGNVWEWIEASIQNGRGLRGASYDTYGHHMQAADRHFGQPPATDHALIGIRLARVPRHGDLNCNEAVDFGDINPFVKLLADPAGWRAAYPGCDHLNGDINDDATVDFADINPFVALLTSP